MPLASDASAPVPRLSPFAFRLSPFAFRLSPFAFRLSPFAFRLSLFAFRLASRAHGSRLAVPSGGLHLTSCVPHPTPRTSCIACATPPARSHPARGRARRLRL
ncbi:hypothetical protein EGY20_10555 [Burkholderia multivorans]|nr:hypothetical protein EGY20_10555 [Burkholderia multivorans]